MAKSTEINERVATALALLGIIAKELCVPSLLLDRIDEEYNDEVRLHLASDGVDRGRTIIIRFTSAESSRIRAVYWSYDRSEREVQMIPLETIDHPFTRDW